jgi:septal ring factor EnvC (AmiA/AmiB activator)
MGSENQTATAEPTNQSDSDKIEYAKYRQLLDEKKQTEAKYKELLDAEQKKAEEIARKNGEYEKLYNEIKPKAEEAKILAEKLEKLEQQRRDDLLSKLPDDKKKKYEKFDIDVLSAIVSDFATVQQVTTTSPGTQTAKKSIADKGFADMNDAERLEVMNQNPSLYAKLIDEFNKNYYGVQ